MSGSPPQALHLQPGWRGRLLRRRTLLATCSVALIFAPVTVYFALAARSTASAPPPPVSRLLVLPFNVSETKGIGREFGAELASEISDSLAHVVRLQISGRTSADTLAAAHTTALEAGRRLGVDAVLSGALTERSGGLRVTAQLMATSDGRVLWSRVYDRQATDIFEVQSSIATAVVRELVGLLNPAGLLGVPSVEPDTRDLEAYRLYLRGAHQVRLRGDDSLRLALDLFSAALRRDPTYARASAGIASAYALLPSYSSEDSAEMYALAEKAMAKADQLSHNRYMTAGTRAYLGFMRGQWVESELAFHSAIVADPNNSELRQWYSQLLGAVGRIDAALAQARLAQEIDPLGPIIANRLSILNLWLGRDNDAASDAALMRELGLEEDPYPETKILLKLHQHDDERAADDLRALQVALHRPDTWVDLAFDAYRHPEKRPAAIQLLDRIQAAGGMSARIYYGLMVLLQSPARALHTFPALPDHGANDLEFLFSTDAAAVRRDLTFGEFVHRMGLDAYWDRFGWPPVCRRDNAHIACH
jgi:TolB-like protein/Tfp pilus assembly protein PilF